jgi:ribosomal protein L29
MIIKAKEIKKFSEKESQEKLKELRLELIKARISAGKSGKAKIREIKKAIARIKTIMRMQK